MMDKNTKEKTTQLLAKLALFFFLVIIISLPIWLFTIFGSIIVSILVFAVEMLISLLIILGTIN